MMPRYRLSESFIRLPDEYGRYPEMDAAAAEQDVSSEWRTAGEEYIVGPDGQATGPRLPNQAEATPEDVSADVAAWATSFARGQRARFIQNHKHDCTATCVKYQNKEEPGSRWPRGSVTPRSANIGHRLSKM